MSQKRAKKIRKEIRNKLDTDMTLLRQIMKDRPKYFPEFLWKWGLKIYMKEEIDYNPLRRERHYLELNENSNSKN